MILALLVDDEPSLCNVAKQFLEQSDEIIVDTVFSAQEALRSLDQKVYDVIISDYQMSGMDGIQLLKSLRSTGISIPFILFTGRGREEVVIEALNNGADSYLQKGGNVIAQFAELENAIAQVVKKKRAEDSLRSNEEKLRLITDNTRDTLWLMDMQMKTTWISPSVFRTRGYTLEELASMPLDQHLTPQSLQKAMLAMSTMLTPENLMDPAKEIAFDDELEYYRKDGTTFWADTAIALLRDKLGQPAGFVAVGRDITERKRAEEALRESEVRYRGLFNSTLEGIAVHEIVFDADGVPYDYRFLDINPEFERMTGLEREKVIGRTVREVLPNIEPIWIERYGRVALTGESDHFEQYAESLGKHFEVSVYRNAPKQFTTSFSDVTERKALEETIRDNERRYRNLYHHAQVALFETSLSKGTGVACNKRFCDLMGFATVEEAIGKDVLQLYESPEDREEVKRTLRAQGCIKNHIVRFRNQMTGKEFWGEFSAQIDPARDIAEGTIVDVTERMQMGKELRESSVKYQLLLRSLPVGVTISDSQGGIIESNQEAEHLLGLSQEEQARRNIAGQEWKIIRPDGTPMPPEEFASVRALNEQRTVRDVEMGIVKGEETVWINVTAAPVPLEGYGVAITYNDITERKRAEEALRMLAARNDAILAAVPDIIAEVDDCKRFTWVNQPGLRFYGKDVVGREASFYFEGEQDTYAKVQPLFDGSEDIIHLESWQRRQDGEKRLLSWWCRALKDEQGRVTGALSSARDITERKRVEEALLEAQERYKSLYNHLLDLVYVHDLEGNFLDANPATLKLLGYSAEEVASLNFSSILDPTQLPLALEAVTEIKTTGGQKRFTQFRLRSKNGEYVEVETVGSIIYDHGRPYAIQGVGRNITERKRAEEALRESEERIRLLLNSAAEAIYGVDMNGNCTFCNDSCLRLLEYKHPDELLGKNMHWQIHAKHSDGTAFPIEECHIVQALKKGEAAHVDGEVLWRSDGTSFPAEYWSYPQLHDGLVVGAVMSFLDITERIYAEREREVLYAIGEAINTNAGLEEILQTIHHNIKKVMYAENCYIALYDVGTETMSFPFFIDQTDPTPTPRANRRGLTEYVLRTARPLLLTPELLEELVREHEIEMIGTPPESWLGVPLSIQSKPIGVLVVQSYEPGRKYADREKDVLMAIGNQAARIIERKRAEDALREAHRKLNLLTNITRHDILNQIMSMRGYLELANDNRDPLKANELRKKALGATRNIESMIEFTKDYQEIGVREPAWHNVRAEVDTLDPNLTSLGFWLENQLPEVEIFADPMLVKVLQSIADNSARHGVHATLMRFSSETEGEALKIICEDDGVGVSVDEKGKIFERGYGKHTGLGLHFAREVLHITRIDIEENGEPGKGARFVISVPKGRWRYAGEEKKIAGVRNKKLT